jgi:glycosyltransferase involved in cell wall biosynthesis
VNNLLQVFHSARQLPRNLDVVEYPSKRHNEAKGTLLLFDSLGRAGCKWSFFPSLSGRVGINLIFYPMLSLVMKIKGVRLVNIHWLTGPWQPPRASTTLARALLWGWYRFWILSLRVLRIGIIYTVHDHIPHTKVFNNDIEAVKYTIRKSSGVVFLNEYSKNYFSDLLTTQPHRVIPEGAIHHPITFSQIDMRNNLDVPEKNILVVLVGALNEYKGVDLILSGIKHLPSNISIRIAGDGPSPYLSKLKSMLKECQDRGLDIDIHFGVISDEEFGGYLDSADFFLYPCRTINNSGSLIAALSHSLPIIVPTTPQLSWIPESLKILLSGNENQSFGIQESLKSISKPTDIEKQKFQISCRDFLSNISWEAIAESYIELFEEVICKKSRT